jgi:hypothetical protein
LTHAEPEKHAPHEQSNVDDNLALPRPELFAGENVRMQNCFASDLGIVEILQLSLKLLPS